MRRGATPGVGFPVKIRFDQESDLSQEPHVIAYRATLDVSSSTAVYVARLLHAHRARVDRRPWQRAATCWTQAVLVLRWFKDAIRGGLMRGRRGPAADRARRLGGEAADAWLGGVTMRCSAGSGAC